MPTSVRIPCSKCGQLNDVERAAEREFRCTACGAVNTLRSLTASAPDPAVAPAHRRAASWTPTPALRRTGAPAPTAPRSGAMSRARQVLIALVVVATGSAFLHNGGTFATFNATTTNAASITSGTLLLGDKVANGSSTAECFSAGGATPGNPQTINSSNTSSCTSVWNVASPNKPGDAFIAHLQIRNPGNVAASTLQLYASVATCDSAPGVLDAVSGVTFKGANQSFSTTQSGATVIGATSTTVASAAGLAIGDVIQVDTGANLEQLTISNIVGNVLTTNATTKNHANGVAVNGGGLCREAELVVVKTDSSFEAVNTGNGTCLYGDSASAGGPMTGTLKCAYKTTNNLRDFNDNYALGGSNPGPISIAGGIAAGATQYYVIAISFPNGADNGYQGLGASLTFNWFAQQ